MASQHTEGPGHEVLILTLLGKIKAIAEVAGIEVPQLVSASPTTPKYRS
jgi:hypothetical protein